MIAVPYGAPGGASWLAQLTTVGSSGTNRSPPAISGSAVTGAVTPSGWFLVGCGITTCTGTPDRSGADGAAGLVDDVARVVSAAAADGGASDSSRTSGPDDPNSWLATS